MTLVDSNVWIDYFAGRPDRYTQALKSLIPAGTALVGDLIAHEVLRGFRSDESFATARTFFARLPRARLLDYERGVRAAERYRGLRKRGITIRRRADVLIASYCLDEGVALLTRDRDFAPFAKHLGLRLAVP